METKRSRGIEKRIDALRQTPSHHTADSIPSITIRASQHHIKCIIKLNASRQRKAHRSSYYGVALLIANASCLRSMILFKKPWAGPLPISGLRHKSANPHTIIGTDEMEEMYMNLWIERGQRIERALSSYLVWRHLKHTAGLITRDRSLISQTKYASRCFIYEVRSNHCEW